jgi:galactonate dehydratase
MKIDRVRSQIVRLPADEPLADNKTPPGATRDIVVVKITTRDGIDGLGVTFFGAALTGALKAAIDALGALIVGDDPIETERIADKLRTAAGTSGPSGIFTLALSAINTALWDIRGKVLGQPIYELLGGPVRDEISLYTHPDQSKFTSKEGVIAEIRAILDSGHTALKFDPFPYQGLSGADGRAREECDGYLDGSMTRRDERDAAELTALIRETTGPDVDVLIDAHGRFDVPTAIRLCNSLVEAGNIDWFEEPVPPESVNALRQVREKVSAAISVGERGHTKWDFVPILENRLADYIMPDVTWTGGITELKKISALAEAYYIPISPHDASGPINVVAGAQVMMTVPNFYRLETSRWDLSSYNDFILEPLDNSNGALKLSRAPGLGIEMNRAFLEANEIEPD